MQRKSRLLRLGYHANNVLTGDETLSFVELIDIQIYVATDVYIVHTTCCVADSKMYELLNMYVKAEKTILYIKKLSTY